MAEVARAIFRLKAISDESIFSKAWIEAIKRTLARAALAVPLLYLDSSLLQGFGNLFQNFQCLSTFGEQGPGRRPRMHLTDWLQHSFCQCFALEQAELDLAAHQQLLRASLMSLFNSAEQPSPAVQLIRTFVRPHECTHNIRIDWLAGIILTRIDVYSAVVRYKGKFSGSREVRDSGVIVLKGEVCSGCANATASTVIAGR